MGVKSDIRWLKEVDDRVNLFVLISKRGPVKVKELKEFLGSEDWWPTKYYVKDLVDKDLIREEEDGYIITESGEKVFGSLRTVYDIESV